ncbi:amidase [Novosphingobium sp.]|uniref:amidase n=1 Tax=Novosphingobium sp. TaxID=1874826 RepID=UPI001D5A3F92|nr:amidase [Novosphingobium sp.]MBX9665501.1 amidase [Novosphingobium sp.]
MIETPRLTRRSALALGAASAAILAEARAAPAASGPLTALPAHRLAAMIAARQVSSAEVTGAFLDRIERLNPAVNAVVGMPDRAGLMAGAAAADAAVKAGGALGALHGLPHAVKDLSAVAGLSWTMGSPIFKDQVAKADGLMVERLRRAGVVFVGKTNSPEFGLGSHTFNPVWGTTRNPWDLTRSAGGSTGGGAVALALDLLPLADGSDYGGSLRNPAGWNNVFGMRPSIGRVPNDNADDWLVSMGVAGPMARSVADLALLFSVQAGYDLRKPMLLEGDGAAFRAVRPEGMKGKRIGWAGDLGGAVPYEPGVLETCRKALARFEAMGAVVEDAVPDFPVEQAWQAFVKLRHWQQGGNLLAYYRDPAKRALLKEAAVWEVEGGLGLSAFDVNAWSVVRSQWSRSVHKLLQHYDYWVMPTSQLFPFPADWVYPKAIAGREMRTYHEWQMATCLVTLAGCPAVAVPAGFGAAGLPMGLQIVAPVHGDAACLAAAAAWEAVSGDILTRKPPLA